MFGIAFNEKLLRFILDNYSLQKLSEEFHLNKVEDFQMFFILLHTKGLLYKNTEDIILKGEYELKQKKNGFDSLTCRYYDGIEWDNFNISFISEHGDKKVIVSNVELMALKDYINDI